MKDIKQYIKEMADQGLFEAIGDGVSIQDSDYKVLYQNKVHKDLIGDHTGEYCYQAYEKKEDVCEGCPVAKTFEDGKIHKAEREASTDKGTLYVNITASPLKDSTGEIIAGIEIVRDITAIKHAEEKMTEYHKELEHLVDKRTAELEDQKRALEQKNIVLQEVIGEIESQKNKIKDDFLTNINELVLPTLKEFKAKGGLDDKYTDLMMQNLKKITSSFGSDITSRNLKLTPREIEVCNMIEKGFTNKDISKFINLTVQSVEDHRKNIRKKLGLTNKKVNLTSYLRDL